MLRGGVTCEHVCRMRLLRNKSGIADRGYNQVEAPTGTAAPGQSHGMCAAPSATGLLWLLASGSASPVAEWQVRHQLPHSRQKLQLIVPSPVCHTCRAETPLGLG